MKSSEKEKMVANGRKCLRQFFQTAKRSGRVYYMIPNVARSGMSRSVKLLVVKRGRMEVLHPVAGLGDNWKVEGAVIAKDWGFDLRRQAFLVHGCGMDMVFWLIDHLAAKAGLGSEDLASKLQQESL